MRNVVRTCAVLAAVVVAATFAFRSGVPGLRHDWIWPQDARAFPAIFVGGLSAFASHGYGGGGSTPSVNVALLLFAVLGSLGVPTTGVLFAFICASIVCAQLATEALIAEIEPRLRSAERSLTAAAYAFGPVLFQKLVAGHVYYVLAYALLPLVALLAWRGARTLTLAPFLAAGLAIAASSGQLQFLCFDALVVLAIVARRPNPRTLAYAACAIGLGILHNGNAVAAALGVLHDVSLARFQATVQWELDQSAHPLDLAPLGGYLGYDRAALAQPWLGAYDVARWCVVVLACCSLARIRRAPVVVFSGLALVALAVASGVYGPFSALVPTLVHAPLFALVREVWHIMALYALALVVLAAIGLGVIPARLRLVFASLAALVGLPFLALGLPREVPAIAARAVAVRSFPGANAPGAPGALVALRPFAEPLALVGDPRSAGVDPARLEDDVLSAGDPPPIARVVLLAPQPNAALLADLGIAAVRARPRLVSRLGAAFEPNVGADPAGWNANEARLRASPDLRVAGVRPRLALEAPDARGPLEAALADGVLPGGVRVPLASSYEDDDVERSWVSGRSWWWQFPRYERLVGDPVFTRGVRPYALDLPRGTSGALDVLLAGGEPAIGGVRGRLLGAGGDGPYAWWQWSSVPPAASLAIGPPGRRLRAVAAVLAAADPRWSPPREGRPAPVAWTAVAVRAARADRIDAELPPSSRARMLVYGRAYSPGWRLQVDGDARAIAAVRVHGLYAGWRIPPSAKPLVVHLSYAPSRLTGALVALASGVELLVLGGLALRFARRPSHAAA